MSAEMAAATEKKAPIFIRLWPLYIILGGLALAYFMGWTKYLTLDELRANIGWLDAQIARNVLLVAAVYVVLYATCTAFMVPGGILTIAGGALFGLTFGMPLVGAAATVIGATAGASVLFFAAKTSIGGALRDIAGPFMSKMEAAFNESPINYLISLRLVPAVPFAVANAAPALLGAKYRDYLITTFFGIIPGTFAYSWLGAAAGEVIRDENISTENAGAAIAALGGNIAPALIALFVVSLIPIAYKKVFGKNAKLEAA